MPSQLLHALFGEDVIAGICKRLEPRYRKALAEIPITYKAVFTLGCQGPDIFYHSRRRRPVGLEYGTLLHRRGAGTFAARLLEASLSPGPVEGKNNQVSTAAPGLFQPIPTEKGINALGAYALGFMTHPFLDRLAHPYIVYRSGWLSTTRGGSSLYAVFHAFFERIIDVVMLKTLRGAEISTWDQVGLLAETCENPPEGLKELLEKALILSFPERAGKDDKLSLRIGNAFPDCAGFYRMTSPEYTGGKTITASLDMSKDHLPYIYPEFPPGSGGGFDFLNLEHSPWYYPAGDEREDSRSFPEVYSDAVEAASEILGCIINKYLEEGIFPFGEAAGSIGDGGLSIVDDAGKPCAPCRADPLPLMEVLEGQAALRGLA